MVFRALADPTRRALLDRLNARNGQTLADLCAGFPMTRQSATQHLDILEQANLIATIRHGRQKLHYLNPVPIHELQGRWINKFEDARLRSLRALKQKAEHIMSNKPTFVYVTYVESTADDVWDALTDAETTAAYWGHSNVSDWKVGSRWEHQRTDGSHIADTGGTVIESMRPVRLVTTWEDPTAETPATPSKVTFHIEPFGSIVRLTVIHEDLPDQANRDVAAHGWAAVLSNLKSYLETGHVLSSKPWEMP